MFHRKYGFTLAELLIALAILGVIATFTIPKVLQAQQNNAYKTIGKEAAATLAQAHQLAALNGKLSATMKNSDLTPYLNYVSVVTTGSVDAAEDDPVARDCSTAGYACLRMHNGSIIHFYWGTEFGGNATTNAIWWDVDPDGKVNTNGQGKSVTLFMYYDGKLRDSGSIEPNTTELGWTYAAPNPASVPPWFDWN